MSKNTLVHLKAVARQVIEEHDDGPPSDGDRVIVFRHGRKLIDLRVPHCCPAEETDAKSLPRPGWDFADGRARFDGTLVPIVGQKLAVLKVLAEARRPLAVDDLKAAWGDEVSDENVRWTVGELRKLLQKEFPDWTGADPISGKKGEGYELVIR